ncbi:MAG: competence/damage-inducible protein A [Pseudomonadota bacterium]|jgi:nicotinamide-nucleotide amidase|nr:competence/damage-inducible protein A [Pseudomonadota bacterium]NLX30126.1 competence/damage-inducible protein A [Deltaproteobacteria bacterium]HNU86212.1 competence/damage-inducible protein A [Syntrophales bacterium]HNZ35734.1 competence/damage-inducible protein A [Syntrophales bacterium]HOF73689.1 competence/damage-inducible protein A [Syntrophales bacterium]
MNIGILTIGNELTSGRIADTNTSYLAREFHVRGWDVPVSMAVGDEAGAIGEALDFILERSDAVVVTGGLGPTADDITTECIAKYCGLPLYLDEAVLQTIRERFAARGLRWTDNNAKQAMFPQGAEPLRNPVGTAWGYVLNRGGKLIAVVPGVPMEVKRMTPEVLVPLFEQKAGKTYILTKTIKLFGLAEALIDSALADLPLAGTTVSLGFYPRFPENHLVLTARSADRARAEADLALIGKGVVERLSRNIFGYDEDTLEGMIGALLTEKKLTISIAESLTGGLIADRITNVPGSSAYFERGIVAYSNRSKTELLGVPEEVIREHGAVSRETAVLMAEGVRKTSGADVGLATTGIAGPSGGTGAKPVGTVFIAVSDGTRTVCRDFAFKWERRRIKEITTQWALELTRRFLAGESHVQ